MWLNPGGFSVSIKTDLQHCTVLEVTLVGWQRALCLTKAQGLCVFSEKQFFLQHLNIGNVRGLAAAAALSADFSALRVFWSLLLCKAAKITAAS